MVIWITGLSASGKTTLSRAFEARYHGSAIPSLVLLDGDVIRELYGHDLGYSEADRTIQFGRMQKLAQFLERQSAVVIVAALYANDALLSRNRELFMDYFEVYLQADLALLQSRDGKGLYARALKHEITDVVGVDIPWTAPVRPHLVFDMSQRRSPEAMAEILYDAAFGRSR